MKKFNKKIVEVADAAKDLIEKILRWRDMEMDRLLHIKYEPHKSSAKSHFEAIMMDVNESGVKVEEYLKIQQLAEGLHAEIPNLDLISEIELSDDERADIEHKKRLKKQKEMQIFLDSKTKR